MATPPPGDQPARACVPPPCLPASAPPAGIALRAFAAADQPRALALWRASTGVGITPEDEPEPLARFLARNPGLSQVALRAEALVGTVLCGHDGRRGHLVHLAVAAGERGQGIGAALVSASLAALAARGIQKCNLLVFADNAPARAFYHAEGWTQRRDLLVMQRMTDGTPM